MERIDYGLLSKVAIELDNILSLDREIQEYFSLLISAETSLMRVTEELVVLHEEEQAEQIGISGERYVTLEK